MKAFIPYCISARSRTTGMTKAITGPMVKEVAEKWIPSVWDKRLFKYFRVSAYPFKGHLKDKSYQL